MTGDKPGKRPSALCVFILGVGYLFSYTAINAAKAGEAEAQHTDLIPQSEIVVQNEPADDQGPITYSVRIFKEPDRIKLKGNLASEEDYKTLIGLVKANFPAVDLTDRLKVNEAAPDGEVKVGGLSFALKLLGYVETGQASVDDNGLSFEGSASTAVVLTEVKKLLENNKPTGVPLKNIRIAPPAKSWFASVTPDGEVKISGVVPDEAGKQAVTKAAKDMFPSANVEDGTAVNANLPARWTKAAQHSLKLLRELTNGSVELTDQIIHLKGSAPDEGAISRIDKLAADLPSGFALKSEVSAPVSHFDAFAAPLLGPLIPSR
ncbi:MAG: hypothetical protein HC850_17590 [Rhodomicrobium sp.]|nr:hypothetical protein [Rhodomicrobium sp.]